MKHGLDSTFVPTCPACGYELVGIPDGACPECGGAFSYAVLLAEARAAAAAKAARALPPMTGADVRRAGAMVTWVLAFGAPTYLLGFGVLSIVIARGELGRGHYWSDAPSWFPWPQAGPAPTVRSSLYDGQIAVGIGCTLAIGAVCAWRMAHRSGPPARTRE